LGVAILAEVIATTLLKTSEGFTRGWPSVATVLVYGVSFWCLAQTLGTVPTGVAYAIWSGVGHRVDLTHRLAVVWPKPGRTGHHRHGLDHCGGFGHPPVFALGRTLNPMVQRWAHEDGPERPGRGQRNRFSALPVKISNTPTPVKRSTCSE